MLKELSLNNEWVSKVLKIFLQNETHKIGIKKAAFGLSGCRAGPVLKYQG